MKLATAALAVACSALTVAAQRDPIVSYVPAEDVTEHAKIDLDIKEIGTLAGDKNYVGAEEVYENGKNSIKSATELRTLKGFSTRVDGLAEILKGDDPTHFTEYFLFKDFYGSATYADKFVMEALKDNSDVLAGIPSMDDVRKQLAVKGIQYQSVWMFILREMYESLSACRSLGMKPKNWDEAVAFYVGSIVAADPSTQATSGQSMYTLVEKRCATFGQCNGNEPAYWNDQAMKAFRSGLVAIQAKDCPAIAKNIKLLRKIMQIPLIQGTLQYAHKTNPTAYPNIEDVSMKAAAEAWAFLAGVLPFLNESGNNDEAQQVIMRNLVLNATTHETFMKDGTEVVFDAIYSTLGDLCIKCSDIGIENMENAKGDSIPSTGAIPQCVDDEELLAQCEDYMLQEVEDVDPIPVQEEPTNNGVMIGLIVGCVVVLIVIGGVMWYCMRLPDNDDKTQVQDEAVTNEDVEPVKVDAGSQEAAELVKVETATAQV